MPELKIILEALLLAADEPLTLDRLLVVFPETEQPDRDALRAALAELAADYAGRGLELVEVASGFRLQVPEAFAPWVSRLWEERTAHYSRALLETLALIAYRQPVTRGEIEAVRGVSVSSSIMKTLQERGWIKVIGHREIPGRPALYATTRAFLDYFNLKSLSELPSLTAPRDLEVIDAELASRASAPPDPSLPQTELFDG
ncbi:MAG: SMC-Scp complex subunit ScpB [Candidatus Competibacteraceae bacterium]